jgi:hypothetical protein
VEIPPVPVFLTDGKTGPIVPGPVVSRLQAIVVFREVDGQVDVAQVQLISHDPALAITADLWRRVRIGDVIARARSGLSAVADIVARGTRGDLSEQATRLAAKAQPGPGRPRDLTDEHLREVADVYLRARVLAPRRARQLVADHFKARHPRKYSGLDDADDHRVKSWIQAATNRGFIPRNGN